MPVDVERWKRRTILIFGALCLILFVIIALLFVIAIIGNLLGW